MCARRVTDKTDKRGFCQFCQVTPLGVRASDWRPHPHPSDAEQRGPEIPKLVGAPSHQARAGPRWCRMARLTHGWASLRRAASTSTYKVDENRRTTPTGCLWVAKIERNSRIPWGRGV